MMLNYTKSISIFLILQLAICFSSDIPGSKILEKAIKRLDGIDHTISVDVTTFKKKNDKKSKKINVNVHFGTDKKTYKMIYLEEGSNGSKGRELLIHEYEDKSIRTWVKYPKSGKIKEIKDKKLSKKIDISEITIPLSFLDKQIKILSDDIVNDINCKVVEISNEDEKIRFWIDLDDFIIHKKEHYDRKSKLYKVIEYFNLIAPDNIKYYKNIKTKYIKDKTTADLVVNEFKVVDFKDNGIFKAPK